MNIQSILLLQPPFEFPSDPGGMSKGCVDIEDAPKTNLEISDLECGCEECAHLETEFNKYNLGALVHLTGEFTDTLTGDDVDPSQVSLSIRNPDGEITTYTYGDDSEMIQDSAGHYSADITVDLVGEWYYRWWSSGTGQASKEGMFEVVPTEAFE